MVHCKTFAVTKSFQNLVRTSRPSKQYLTLTFITQPHNLNDYNNSLNIHVWSDNESINYICTTWYCKEKKNHMCICVLLANFLNFVSNLYSLILKNGTFHARLAICRALKLYLKISIFSRNKFRHACYHRGLFSILLLGTWLSGEAKLSKPPISSFHFCREWDGHAMKMAKIVYKLFIGFLNTI